MTMKLCTDELIKSNYVWKQLIEKLEHVLEKVTNETFTGAYADYFRLQDECAKKCAEYDWMGRTVARVMAQI